MTGMMDKMKIFFGFEEDLAKDIRPQQPQAKPPVIRATFKPAQSQSQSRFPTSEIKVEEPRIYEDSLNIATHLRENKPVIVNLKNLDSSTGKRLIDFVCGTAYAINGHMMKIGDNIFLFTPESVLIVDSEDKSQFERGIQREESHVFFQDAVGSN